MKSIFSTFTFLFALLVAVHAQQIPNGGFDAWTANPFAPDSWSTYESAFGQPLGLSMKDTIDKIAGTASLSLFADSVAAEPALGVLPGVASLGSVSVGLNGPEFHGVPFTYRPDTLYFAYKYVPSGTDTALLFFGLKRNGTYLFGQGNHGPITSYLVAKSNWTLAGAPIFSYYDTSNHNMPDTMELTLYASVPAPYHAAQKGSNLHVDAMFFGYKTLPTALQEVADKLNISIYPNPASDALTVSANDNSDGFRTVITDMNGRLVAAKNLEGKKTTIDISDFSTGTYIYLVADKNGNILKRDRFNVVR